jgi:hypothetical protein
MVFLLACLPEVPRQRCIEQEDDNQSNVTFESIDAVDDFGPIIPSPSGEADPMEFDLHSRGSISAVHELEVAAYGNHGLPHPTAPASACRLCTSIKHNSATRNSHIFAC